MFTEFACQNSQCLFVWQSLRFFTYNSKNPKKSGKHNHQNSTSSTIQKPDFWYPVKSCPSISLFAKSDDFHAPIHLRRDRYGSPGSFLMCDLAVIHGMGFCALALDSLRALAVASKILGPRGTVGWIMVESVLDIQHIWDIWDIRDDIWDIRDDRSSFIPYIIIYPRIFVYV